MEIVVILIIMSILFASSDVARTRDFQTQQRHCRSLMATKFISSNYFFAVNRDTKEVNVQIDKLSLANIGFQLTYCFVSLCFSQL